MAVADEVKNARELTAEVCRILGRLGLPYALEHRSRFGSAIINKARHIDIAVLGNNGEAAMHIECKVQNKKGSAEDKLFRAVEEANRDKSHGMPSIIVFGGFGWTDHDLRFAMLNGAVRVEYLETWLRCYFNYRALEPESVEAGEDQTPAEPYPSLLPGREEQD